MNQVALREATRQSLQLRPWDPKGATGRAELCRTSLSDQEWARPKAESEAAAEEPLGGSGPCGLGQSLFRRL